MTKLLKPECRLQIVGEIDAEGYKEFSSHLYELEAAGEKAVVIELCSPGGDSSVALAYCARIRRSTIKNLQVMVYGECASAAVLILACASKRYMTKEAWVMVHEDSTELEGDVSEIEREISHMRAKEVQWCDLLYDYTKVASSEWAILHKATTYLTPNECLAMGLIDGIV